MSTTVHRTGKDVVQEDIKETDNGTDQCAVRFVRFTRGGTAATSALRAGVDEEADATADPDAAAVRLVRFARGGATAVSATRAGADADAEADAVAVASSSDRRRFSPELFLAFFLSSTGVGVGVGVFSEFCGNSPNCSMLNPSTGTPLNPSTGTPRVLAMSGQFFLSWKNANAVASITSWSDDI